MKQRSENKLWCYSVKLTLSIFILLATNSFGQKSAKNKHVILHDSASESVNSLYAEAIQNADYAYDFKWLQKNDDPVNKHKFEIARDLYQKALQIKPNETYPSTRLIEIDKVLYDFKTKPIYQKLISIADSLLKADNYTEAKTYYTRADSLYSKDYTKERLLAITALLYLSKHPTLSIDSVKHGTSFGMCDGYCYNETIVTKDTTTEVAKSWKVGDTDKIKTSKTNEDLWKRILQSIDLKAFYKLKQTIGCPDCLDGGAEWIEICTTNYTYKVIFDYTAKIDKLNSLLEIFRETNK